MGKTVPSYRLVLEFEISKWKRFRNALRNKEDEAAFDELMDMCRNHAMAGGCACNPVPFYPMVMSIFLDQTKRLTALEEQLNVAAAKKVGLAVTVRYQGDGALGDCDGKASAQTL